MAKRTNLLAEFGAFLLENKAYWIAPVVLVLLGLALIVILGSTSAAPFIYTLF